MSIVFCYVMIWISLVTILMQVLLYVQYDFIVVFNCRFQLENNQSVTVEEYYVRKKNVPLRYPFLPCLHVGSLNRETPIYLPSEVRKILFLNDERFFLQSKSSSHDIWRGMIGCMYLPFREIHYKIPMKKDASNYHYHHHHHHTVMFPPVLVIL